MMKQASWILGSLAALALAACGPKPADNAGAPSGTESGAASVPADTGMGTGAVAPADTAMTGTDTATGSGAVPGHDSTSR
jgi:hypothetical protein